MVRVLLLVALGASSAQPSPLSLAAANDRAAVVAALGDPDPHRRAEAALALGRLQDAADFLLLAPPLADKDEHVRARAAEALGLLSLSWDPVEPQVRVQLAAMLSGAASHETSGAVREMLAWSLGRAGGPVAIESLQSLLGDPDAAVRARAAFSLGVLARQKQELPAGLSGRLVQLATDPSADVRSGAAYALSLTGDAGAVAVLEGLLGEPKVEVRLLAARALGRHGDPAVLEKAAASDSEATVRVEAVRALQALAGAKGPQASAAAAALARLGKALAASERSDPGARSSGPLELLLRPGKELPAGSAATVGAARAALAVLAHPRTADEARLACLAAAAAAGKDPGRARAVRRCGEGQAPAGLPERLEATALALTPGSSERLATLASPSRAPAIRAAALDALSRVKGRAAATAARAALAAPEPAVAGAAADASAALVDAAARPALLSALGRFTGADGTDAALSIVAALGALGPDPAADAALAAATLDPRVSIRTAARAALAAIRPPGAPLPARQRPQVRELPPIDSGPEKRVQVLTDKGTFVIELLDQEAPIAAGNFRRLVRGGFFDGLTFHRIEPGFVAQGGDPHGDGSGGPGWAIPCENAATPYERGTVGMALSGKDTGGSQWFVTLERTPHLEGRYTAFGRVVAGMDVVESLLASDRMKKVELEGPAATTR